jgi:hypothetical protein
MLFPFARSRTDANGVPPSSFVHSPPNFPSVTSVTSVRCFSIRAFSHGSQRCPPKLFHSTTPNFPFVTSVTSVRCFSIRVFSHGCQRCSPKLFRPLPPNFPLCDLRVLCAMLFHSCVLARKANDVHPSSFIPPPPISLCDLRDLCAMLFYSRVLARMPTVFPQALSSTTPISPL